MSRLASIRPALALILIVLRTCLAFTRAGGEGSKRFTAEQLSLWSLQPLRSGAVPAVKKSTDVRTPIDAFLQVAMEQHPLPLAQPADRATLLRRASLDLIGLPPTPEEIRDFEQDSSADAFERVIGRLLASPQYGERWARHWLDLARYAESEGFKADETRPNAWRYRDYVIRSFNADKPYDRFIQEQLAGDELWPDDPDARIATGFNRHYPDESNARNLMQRRQEILNDIVDTSGAVFAGLTFACARCHDHKWDPITQADYYRLQAFFAGTAADDNIPLVSPSEIARHRQRLVVWEEKTHAIRDAMAKLEQPHRDAILHDYVDKYPENIQIALKKPAGERTAFEQQMVAKANLYLDPESHQYLAPASACVGKMKKENKAHWRELTRELEGFAALHPGELPLGTGIREVADDAPATHVLNRGNWNSPKEEVQPGFLTVLQHTENHLSPTFSNWVKPSGADSVRSEGRGEGFAPVAFTDSSRELPSRRPGRRTALANWFTDPTHPLTARVMVNRIWQHHFGRGLVGTSADFGLKGDRPTHPELLDWLAQEFIRGGWSMKHLHRLIMTSAAYQRASEISHPQTLATDSPDPENHLLARFHRHRLNGETIRDAALFVAGRLNLKAGGPSVFPELPPGMESRGGWNLSVERTDRDRRSVYVFVRRNTRYPMFETFDMPDTHETCARRNVTTSPTQALTLLNSRLTHEWAQGFAGRVLATAGADETRQIEAAFRLAYARLPEASEILLAREFFDTHRAVIAERRSADAPLALPEPMPSGIHPDHAVTLVDFCHALLNSNEFVYRN